MSQIYELIPKVMTEIGAIPKADRNRVQNYRFRSIDAVLKVCQPVLTKHGVSLSVRCENHKVTTCTEAKPQGKGERTVYHAALSMRVTLFAPDGSNIENVSCGEGLDYGGDKATNKAMAAAFKYAMLLGLCVPVEPGEVDDSDRPVPGGQAVLPHQGENNANTKTPPTSATGTGSKANVSNAEPATHAQIGEIKEICKSIGWNKEKLIELLKTKGIASPAALTVGQAGGLINKLKGEQLEKDAEETFG